MSLERAMILRQQPQMLLRRIDRLLSEEIKKGCTPDISPIPVPLEPPFRSLMAAGDDLSTQPLPATGTSLAGDALSRLTMWISPDQRFDWNRSEQWLKQLAGLPHRVVFQIAGNEAHIEITISCHPEDRLVVATAFEGQFDLCKITAGGTDVLETFDGDAWERACFHEFYPPPPYSHNLTTHDELQDTPFQPLLTAMRGVTPPAVAFYQCAFEPVSAEHNWHQNVSLLLDLEYVAKLYSGPGAAYRASQQIPSGDLRQMAKDVVLKAHNDKPFFSAVVRVGLVGGPEGDEAHLAALGSVINMFQHGGRCLRRVSHRDFATRLRPRQIKQMIIAGLPHRSGFLVNSKELAGLVHVIPAGILESREIPVKTLPTLPIPPERIRQGTWIGTSSYAGVEYRVCIPAEDREISTHIISAPREGKTTMMVHMLLQDIENDGAVFIDAHGDAIKELLRHIKREHWQRVIYFNPADRDWVPLWNPLFLSSSGDLYRLADDFVAALKHVSQDWGDRLEHVVRNSTIGVLHLPNPCLLDLYTLMRQKTPESDRLREQIIARVEDEPVRKFWQNDFTDDYKKGDLQSPKHKLSKLVSGGMVSLMLSQPDSLINFRQTMDQRNIVLADLSGLGAAVLQLLGLFILKLYLTAAVSRVDTPPKQRVPFHIYVDEAHLYVAADAIENIITQARKFRVDLCLAHHYLKQFQATKVDALSTVGTTIIGRLDKHDSEYFANHLQGKVEPAELTALKPHEMIARIGTDIVRMKSREPLPPEAAADGHEIIQESRRRYYRPAAEVRKWIRNRDSLRREPFAPLAPALETHGFTDADLCYDEF